MAQALTTAVQGIMGVVSPIMKIAQPIVQGLGVVSNIIQGQRAAGLQSTAINNVNQLSALANNPAAMSARIRALQQPLSQGLVSGVGNEVQGYLAERGLGLSPAIQSQVLGQALGPYQLQEQQLATQTAFAPYRDLGYLTEAAQRTGPGIANTQGFWDLFNQGGAGGGAGGAQITPSPNLPQSAWPTYMPNYPTSTPPFNPNQPAYSQPIPYSDVQPMWDVTPPSLTDVGVQFPGVTDFSIGGG